MCPLAENSDGVVAGRQCARVQLEAAMEQIDNYRLDIRDQAESRESNPFWNSIESVPNSLRSSLERSVLQSQLRKQRAQTHKVQSSAVAWQWEK